MSTLRGKGSVAVQGALKRASERQPVLDPSFSPREMAKEEMAEIHAGGGGWENYDDHNNFPDASYPK
jgi:hypothetical protein